MYYKLKEFPECNIMQITAEQAKKERENILKEIERMITDESIRNYFGIKDNESEKEKKEVIELEDKIKPCPFCGNTASIVIRTKQEGFGEVYKQAYVECDFCGARGTKFGNRERIRYIESAANAWNIRSEN